MITWLCHRCKKTEEDENLRTLKELQHRFVHEWQDDRKHHACGDAMYPLREGMKGCVVWVAPWTT